MADLAETVVSILGKYAKGAPGDVSAATLLDKLEMDSLDTLESVMAIEEALGVEIDPSEFAACCRIADVVEVVARASAA